MRIRPILFALLALSAWSLNSTAQDHGHLNIGATAQVNGSSLVFENGADFATNSLFVKTLSFASSGKHTGLFEGNITFTALHSKDPFGEPEPLGPAPGAFITAEIVSVQGPTGGRFDFWDSGALAATHQISVGATNAAFSFSVSDAALGAGQPDGDPYGHVHGRRFTATQPGLYTVAFRAVDHSTNGIAGGPIHTDSAIISVHFQAGVNIVNVSPSQAFTEVTFAAPMNYSWQLQAKDSLADSTWIDVGAPILGNDLLTKVNDERPPAPLRFYRLGGIPLNLNCCGSCAFATHR